MKSQVYFAQVTSQDLKERASALERILDRAATLMTYKDEEIVPVKITIGDSACVHHVAPDHVKAIVSRVKAQKAKPFLFDTSVIYQGMRQNAVDHLTLVQNKGFAHTHVGAPFVVADGLLGTDGREIAIEGAHIKKIRVPSFVGMLESLVVVSHATGHIFSGFAGALKNVAMGMSCRATKQVQHSSLKPSVIVNKCTACGCCARICPAVAIAVGDRGKARVDQARCVGCGECLCACKFDAIFVNWDEDMDVFCARMSEVAFGILKNFPRVIFITLAWDMTKECDCISTKDEAMIGPAVGIFASTDPVSVDQAVVDRMIDEKGFLKAHQAYKNMLAYAEKIGCGHREYEEIIV